MLEQPPFDQTVGGGPSTGADSGDGLFDDPLLDGQQLDRCVTTFVSHTGEEAPIPAAHLPNNPIGRSRLVEQFGPGRGGVVDDLGRFDVVSR